MNAGASAAIVLVGGLGTRLRPLTDHCPKPLVPLANIPFMRRRLDWLARQGLTEVVLAVQHLAEAFHQARLERGSGLRLQIVEEPEPRGTAGATRYAVARCLPTAPGPLLVLNGDVLTDLALRPLLDYHRRSGALATIAVAEVADPSAYGVVVADPRGRVSAFQEKPAPGTALAQTVNTGTYVLEHEALEHIPPDSFAMFERDLFPTLLARGLPIAAYRHTALWLDIGTLAGYLEANSAILAGQVRDEALPGAQLAPGIWAEAGTRIHPCAELLGPLLLGRGAQVDADARLVGPLAIGANAHIGAGAQVEHAVLWDQVVVGAGAQVRRAVLATGAVVPDGGRIEHTALGAGQTAGEKNSI